MSYDHRTAAGKPLNRPTILAALERLAELLRGRGETGEICLFGGTVMVLVFQARPSTKDVDAIFEPTGAIRQLAEIVRHELHLPADWLNDGVKGFASHHSDLTSHDVPQFQGLRVLAPTAQYLLAMKCMASRIADSSGADDRADIRFLLDHLKIQTVDAALAIVAQYYPSARIRPKTQFLLEELLEDEQP